MIYQRFAARQGSGLLCFGQDESLIVHSVVQARLLHGTFFFKALGIEGTLLKEMPLKLGPFFFLFLWIGITTLIYHCFGAWPVLHTA